MSESATDTSGPASTYGCACVCDNSFNCSLIRYGYRSNDGEPERCECLCHQWRNEDQDSDDDL